jgi:ribokinase
MENKIIVIGSANTDLTIHSDVMPKLGETLVGSNFQINAGGKGLNQAVAIAKLGGNVSFLGAVGNDSNGRFLLNTLKEYGVVFEGFISESAPTGTAMITVVGGDNFILLDAGANNTLTPEVVRKKSQLIAQSDFCVLQLEIPTETVLEICKIAKENGTKVVLNPAPFKRLPKEIYSFVDYLIPNEHEAESLTGICIDSKASIIKAIEKIKLLGVKDVVITLGDRGCAYTDGNQVVFWPAENVTAVDTTSAGDCFIGALISVLSQNKPISEAITFATKASAITVTREGAAKSIPFANEVE